MKFLIKTLGWDALARGVRARARRRAAPSGGAALPFDPEHRRSKTRRTGRGRGAVAGADRARVRRRTRSTGPGIMPQSCRRVCTSPATSSRAWRATNVRPQKQVGYVDGRSVTIPLGDLTSAQMRVIGELARAYGDGTRARHGGSGPRVPLGARARRRGAVSRASPRRPRRWPSAGTIADVTSCPGAESCRLAVTQSRGLGRLLEDHLRARPDLVAAADGARHQDQRLPERLRPASHRDDRLPGQRPQGRRRAPVPQYFVMVGGGVDDGGATFGRLRGEDSGAPLREARRAADRALSRQRTRRTSRRSRSSAASSSRAVKSDARRISTSSMPATAPADDFIDLAEDHAFTPEVQEGECSA